MFRMTNSEVKLITWFFNEAAGCMGLRSNHGSIEARLAMGLVGDGAPAMVDPMPDWGEQLRRDALRAHRALRGVAEGQDGTHRIHALYWAFGPPHDIREREKLVRHLRERFGDRVPWRDLAGIIERAPCIVARAESRGRRGKRFTIFDADAPLIQAAVAFAEEEFDAAAKAYAEALLTILDEEEKQREARAAAPRKAAAA